MNTQDYVQTDYTDRASRSIETIVLTDENWHDKTCVAYVYNYEGVHWRVFVSVLAFAKWWEHPNDSDVCDECVIFETETEDEVYEFLANYEFAK